MAWEDFEHKVRSIASYIWDCNAISESIAGVQCDCVLKKENGYWIIIEITEQDNLGKVREDINRLVLVRHSLMTKNIFAKCYLVMSKSPTESMRQGGLASNIEVLSYHEYENMWFDYHTYYHHRISAPFGSLIDLETGTPENNEYVDVMYRGYGDEVYHVEDIIEKLKAGKKIILRGDFGSGKSRCVKAIFDKIYSEDGSNYYTIAINLREHWGAKDCKEILRRHFENLGMLEKHTQNFIKACYNSNIIYLVDGFDEIGTQQWDMSERGVSHSRQLAVAPLKDLISQSRGGMLICGREFYFNSDQEMIEGFGLDGKNNVLLLKCPNEFTEKEIKEYIRLNFHKDVDDDFYFPSWFPKRPLVMQMIEQYLKDDFLRKHIFETIFSFWNLFLDNVCEREAHIHPTLNKNQIRQILVLLAQKTRCKANDVGPLSVSDLSDAFERVVGVRPTDETAIMLQRLPGIGRIDAETPERQFLDSFILNGLRTENIIQIQQKNDVEQLKCRWINPMDANGCEILAGFLEESTNECGKFLGFAIRAQKHINQVLASDIIASLSFVKTNKEMDYKNIVISDSWISYLNFNELRVKNINIIDSVIYRLDITNAVLDENVRFERCDIAVINGIASEQGFPKHFVDCTVETYQSINTVSRIKNADLSIPQKILLTIIKKIFFQPGRGRKEEALMRGLGDTSNNHYAIKILNKLIESGIIKTHQGDEGKIFVPIRKHTKRMDDIRTQLTLSKDPIWQYVSKL